MMAMAHVNQKAVPTSSRVNFMQKNRLQKRTADATFYEFRKVIANTEEYDAIIDVQFVCLSHAFVSYVSLIISCYFCMSLVL